MYVCVAPGAIVSALIDWSKMNDVPRHGSGAGVADCTLAPWAVLFVSVDGVVVPLPLPLLGADAVGVVPPPGAAGAAGAVCADAIAGASAPLNITA
jgi:hypothetical protein